MQVQLNSTKPFQLVTHSCSHSGTSAKCRVLYEGKEKTLSVELPPATSPSPHKAEAKLAFAMAVQIVKTLFDQDISVDSFNLPRGGHMVTMGDYNSWGTNPEKAKTRVKADLKDNDIAGFEFYLRHALLAVENQSYDCKITRKRVACL